MEFSIDAIDPAGGSDGAILSGREATVRFKVTDAVTGAPIQGLSLAAWMDGGRAGAAEPPSCKAKIESFLQGTLAYRPDLDLNSWYVLTLAASGSVMVIDPIGGYAGQRLLAMALLDAPGEDWALSRDEKQLFVSMPTANRVAVVDTVTWKVVGDIAAPANPWRVAVQPDGHYLWISHDASAKYGSKDGVAVVDTVKTAVATDIPTGAGPHAIAFSGDDRYALVANAGAGTASLIDIATLQVVAKIEIGGRPIAAAYSPLSLSFYVADAESGDIVVIDPTAAAIAARTEVATGLRALGFTADGRWGLAVDFDGGRLHVLDAATNRVVQSAAVGPRPYQIAFTADNGYVRLAGSDQITMFPLADLGNGGELPVRKFTGGQATPESAPQLETAASIIPSPDGGAVLISNQIDRITYYYAEGMLAPHGSYSNKGRPARGVLTVDRSLREVAPGELVTTVRLPDAGAYDVAVLMDSPDLWHCFSVDIGAGDDAAAAAPVELRYLLDGYDFSVGEATLRFELIDPSTGQPQSDVDDVNVLSFLIPGHWPNRARAESLGSGLYEVTVPLNRPGSYYVFVEIPSLGLRYNELPSLGLRVRPTAVP